MSYLQLLNHDFDLRFSFYGSKYGGRRTLGVIGDRRSRRRKFSLAAVVASSSLSRVTADCRHRRRGSSSGMDYCRPAADAITSPYFNLMSPAVAAACILVQQQGQGDVSNRCLRSPLLTGRRCCCI